MPKGGGRRNTVKLTRSWPTSLVSGWKGLWRLWFNIAQATGCGLGQFLAACLDGEPERRKGQRYISHGIANVTSRNGNVGEQQKCQKVVSKVLRR